MMRLSIIGLDAAERDEIASRLHGVQVISSVADADAAAWVGTNEPDLFQVEDYLQTRRPVLLATAAILSCPELGRVLETACAAEGRVAVTHADRWLPSRRLLLDEVQAPRLGALGLVRWHRWESAPATTCDPAGLPIPLVRDLDQIQVAAGLPKRVYAVQRHLDASERIILQVHLAFPNGGMALLDYTNSLPDGDGYQSLSAISAHGAVYADDHPNTQLIYTGGAPRAELGGEGRCALVALLQSFLDQPPDDAVTARTRWLNLRAVANEIRQSLQTGRAVERGQCL